MEQRDITKSNVSKKSNYFQKYRKQLQKIQSQMAKKDRVSVSMSEPSSEVKQKPQKYYQTEVKMTTSQILPIKSTLKKSIIFQTSPIKIFDAKEQTQNLPKQNQTMKQVQALINELDEVKNRLAKTDGEIDERKRAIMNLKVQIELASKKQTSQEMHNYAQQVISIESRMKIQKELHQSELNKLIVQKNNSHYQNVELSKSCEQLQEELVRLKEDYQQSQKEQPFEQLNSRITKYKADIDKLEGDCKIMEKKVNNIDELRQISSQQYIKYSQIFKKQLIGREIAQSEQRVGDRQSYKRHITDIERKKLMLKDRKIQILLRQKFILQAHKIRSTIQKKIKQYSEELKHLSNQKKMPHFNQKTNQSDWMNLKRTETN